MKSMMTYVQSEKNAPVKDKSDKIVQWERNGNLNLTGVFFSHLGPTDIQNPVSYGIC